MIGKREEVTCECTVEEQTVEHVLERYALAEDARLSARRTLEKDVDPDILLYTEDGIREALKIWGEFKTARREQTTRWKGRRRKQGRRVGYGGPVKLRKDGESGSGVCLALYEKIGKEGAGKEESVR